MDPRFAGSNPAEDDGFLKAMKIRGTTYFAQEVKPEGPCKISGKLKNPSKYERDASNGKIHNLFAKYSCLATR
jgi:hypothetical protein